MIAYAVAADHPDRVERLVVREAPLPVGYLGICRIRHQTRGVA